MTEDGAPAQEFLNQALKEDALDDSYVRNRKPRRKIHFTASVRFCISPSTTRLEILIMAP